MKNVLFTRKLLNMDELIKFKNDPIWNQRSTKNLYRFPLPTDKDFLEQGAKLAIGVPKDEIYQIGQYFAATSPESHISPYKWAIDFLVPDGTEIFAANDGRIIEVVDVYNEWGETSEFRDKLNYLTIQHLNGEYSQYCHLAQNSFQETGLKVGNSVAKGQLIGRVGKTGWTDRDHLHFIVFSTSYLSGNPWSFYSLKINFET